VKPTFDHIAHAVSDVGAAVNGWRELFPELQVLYQDDTWAFVKAGGVRIALVLRGRHPAHIGFRVDDEDLRTLSRQYGVEIKPHRDGTRAFYLLTPGGGAIEYIAYPTGDPYTP
jgi:hypothetical protein